MSNVRDIIARNQVTGLLLKITRDEVARHCLLMVTFIALGGIFNYAYQLVMGIMLPAEQYGILFSLTSLLVILQVFSQTIIIAVSRYTSVFKANSNYGSIRYLWQKISRQYLVASTIGLIGLVGASYPLSRFLRLESAWPLVQAVTRQVSGTPIIGCSVPPAFERARASGALGHLIKPVTRADLKQALKAAGHPVRRVLVVDDDPSALQLFSSMLHVCDPSLEIVTAAGGKEALDQLRGAPPDLMLLDIVMPEMDGWQVLEAMTRDEEVPKVPTFFVSAQDPSDQPLTSGFLLATMDRGLSLSQLLRCSLEISKLLLQPEGALDPVPG